MSHVLTEKLKESLGSLLPIILIVLALNFTFAPMPFAVRGMFLLGALFLLVGMVLFTLGQHLAMMPIGEHLGQYLSKSRKIWLIVIAALLMGTMVTIAEPDLQILARQVPGIPNMTLTVAVAVGLGVFLVLAMLRILYQISMAKLLAVSYIGALVLGCFVPQEYFAVAFDAGGVTTGPFAIPFILALGVGVSSVRGGKSNRDDSFGLAALCSVGPVYAVMILSFFYKPQESDLHTEALQNIGSVPELFNAFLHAFPAHFYEIALAVLPLILLFLVFQFTVLKLPVSTLIRIGVGLVYTYLGLVIFLTGVSTGFMPAGVFIGQYLGGLPHAWILIPLGALIGYFIVLAEPAVRVLIEEVEDLTGGAITKKIMERAFSISVALAIALGMIRVLTHVSIWWVILPGYALAIILSRFSPKIFTAVAFDSGAVASGPMTATFVLPFTMGVCEASGGNIMTDAFGIVALVAMTPLFTVQVVGLIYKRKMADTQGAEEGSFETITHQMESRNVNERWGAAEYSDEQSRFDAGADMDYAASPEWAEEVGAASMLRRIASDNDYIDFEDYDYEHIQSLVTAADFFGDEEDAEADAEGEAL